MSNVDKKFRVAVFTQVYNEELFLPIWLNHYGSMFGYENLIVIDDGSTDGSTNDTRIHNLVKKKRSLLDESDRALLMSLFHEACLQHFDAVIFTDADELILVDPGIEIGLSEYLRNALTTRLNVIGFEVLHELKSEKKLDLTVPLFQQRRFIMFDKDYCKPLISREPIRWVPGFHASDKPAIFAEELFMFHLRSIDYEASRARIKILNTVQFSSESLQKNHASQFRLSEDSYLKMLYAEPNERISNVLDFDINSAIKEYLKNEEFSSSIFRIPQRFEKSIRLSSRSREKTDNAYEVAGLADEASVRINFQQIFEDCQIKMIFSRVRSRLSPCPCGSGERYKHCHGR